MYVGVGMCLVCVCVCVCHTVPKSITVTSERVDSVVHEHVILMKVC